ncbi:MAG: aminotransferase class I/II-fold pyridoxal phosphate-dependent enzyme, partial [Alphaproteobacteria bacterium]|nr:aminotransferase class I/II-fold pyridoxal phosphate-dependent enzyme [Alphaproteobacteria bacterium]
YPSNPTAEVVDLEFYQRIVDFCRGHGIYVLSDLAYAEIYFDDRPPPSILQIPGAKEIELGVVLQGRDGGQLEPAPTTLFEDVCLARQQLHQAAADRAQPGHADA